MKKEKILVTATELFLDLGFKSVTMDDIADALGISKKTIYEHFGTKRKLVRSCSLNLFEEISKGIDTIIAKKNNPIDELLLIHQFVLKRLREQKSSPQYQLQKYYPEIAQDLQDKKIYQMKVSVIENLDRGIAQKVYRNDIQTDIVWRFYFITLEGIRDKKLFPVENYTIPTLVSNFLDYHLRGIASAKGLKHIEKIAKKIEA